MNGKSVSFQTTKTDGERESEKKNEFKLMAFDQNRKNKNQQKCIKTTENRANILN